MNERFTIFFAVWIALGLSSFCFYHFNRNAKLKRWVFPFTLAGTGALFVWFVLWVSGGAFAFVLPLMIPAVALIMVMNWFMTRFCRSCGRTVIEKTFFLLSSDCPYCGASLKWRSIAKEWNKTAEPGATDNPDDAQR